MACRYGEHKRRLSRHSTHVSRKGNLGLPAGIEATPAPFDPFGAVHNTHTIMFNAAF